MSGYSDETEQRGDIRTGVAVMRSFLDTADNDTFNILVSKLSCNACVSVLFIISLYNLIICILSIF